MPDLFCSNSQGYRPGSPAFPSLALILLCTLALGLSGLSAQSPAAGSPAAFPPREVTIVRDSFGIPHIYGQTDADAAYGLAWAHAEDDFASIQHNLLPARGFLGRALGKDGVLFDYAVPFLNIDRFVEAHLQQDVSPEFMRILEAYCQGLNDYAAQNPKDVLVRKALPFTPRDVITGYTVNMSLMGGVGMALKAINDNQIEQMFAPNNRGSNAIAIAPSRTEDGSTWLCINSHQPLEGPFAWYEAHVVSREGWNMLGGLFPGAVTPTLGCNENLGWAHTVNYNQWGDIYTLELDPKNKRRYRYDGEWRAMETRRIKLRVKLGPLVLGIPRTLENSEFGPVFRTKHGTYALRFHAYENILAAEQWYRMNKARNFAEFEEAVQREGLTSFNIIYADRAGTIWFHANGAYPLRDPSQQWHLPLDGTTSTQKWTELLPYPNKPSVLNPDCGYVFNANNTPLVASAEGCNWEGYFPGLQLFTYNRGERIGHLLEQVEGPFTWQQLHAIKFDKRYHPDGQFRDRFRVLFELDPAAHPELADAIRAYQAWDLDASAASTSAALPVLTHYFLNQQDPAPFAFLMIREKPLSEAAALSALRSARAFLLRHHGRLDLPLGQLQRHRRGPVSLPAGGTYEVARAADLVLDDTKKGLFRIKSGDGYIQMLRFPSVGPVYIEAINAYGASSRPESPHYTDQMELFSREQFRRMSLDSVEVAGSERRRYKVGG